MAVKMGLSGFPVAQEEYNAGYMNFIEDFIVQASPEIRSEIQARVAKAIAVEERCLGWTKPYVDWTQAVDLGDLYCGWGPNYLYVWLTADGVPFYAGQAKDRGRVEQFTSTNRSERFKAVVREGGCHAVVVAKHLPQSKINALERGLIGYLKWKDYPIVNEKDWPSPTEYSMARRLAEVGGSTLEEVFLANTEHRDCFEKILDVLLKVVGVKWTGECAGPHKSKNSHPTG